MWRQELLNENRRGVEVWYCSRSRWCRFCLKLVREKWKDSFVEDNMSGGDDPPAMEIEAAITSMIGWVPEESTGGRTGAELVRCSGCLIRIAQAAKYSKMTEIWFSAEQTLMRCD